MNTVEAVFQIPDWIANGLGNGTYERVGGVIREVDSKSVVAWLRETDFTQVSPGQLISSASRLLKFGDAVGVLNLGVSVTGFALILNRIKHLETSISEQSALLSQINQKLDMGFYGNFVAAIRQANNAMMTQNPDTKRISAANAIDRILEAQHYFETVCKAEIASGNELTDKLISTLFLAYTAEVRCHMELGEMALAASNLAQYAETMRTIVQSYLETSYASFDTEYLWCIEDSTQCKGILARLQRLEASLGKDVERHQMITKASDSDAYKQQQDEINRNDKSLIRVKENLIQTQGQNGVLAQAKAAFWKYEITNFTEQQLNTRSRFHRFKAEKQKYYALTLSKMLSITESVIEDMRRFEAYQDEVDALQRTGINLNEWQQIRPGDTAKAQTENMFLLISQTVS